MNSETMLFQIDNTRDDEIRQVIDTVYKALVEKGYNPISQIVGYIMSGDPSYITGHQNARGLITRYERDELLEVVFRTHLAGR